MVAEDLELFFPFHLAQLKVVAVALRELANVALTDPAAALLVWQHGDLDDAVIDGLDQGIVGDGLHEYRSVGMFGGGRDVQLQPQSGYAPLA